MHSENVVSPATVDVHAKKTSMFIVVSQGAPPKSKPDAVLIVVSYG